MSDSRSQRSVDMESAFDHHFSSNDIFNNHFRNQVIRAI
jgi:hypothetical protein